MKGTTVRRKIEAARPVTIAGRAYRKGQVVDVSGLSDRKIGQLLDHRMLAIKRYA